MFPVLERNHLALIDVADEPASNSSHQGFDWRNAVESIMLTSMTHTMLQAVTDDSFQAEVLEAEGTVLVDFTAAWCAPCRVMAPVLSELAVERPELGIVQLDVEAHQQTAASYGVLSMPTFILFRGGQEVLRLVGARSKAKLVRELAVGDA